MKALLLIFFLLCSAGCGGGNKSVPAEKLPPLQVNFLSEKGPPDFFMVEIDGCEYIVSNRNREYGITHRGNCRLCEQRHSTVKAAP